MLNHTNIVRFFAIEEEACYAVLFLFVNDVIKHV